MNEKWFIILNTSSGNGYVKRKKAKIIKALSNLKEGFEIAETKYSKHEIELVNDAVKKGYTNFVSVGGDGTLHHIVNGVFLQKMIPSNQINIGVIPVGTGNDWVKQYKIPLNFNKNIKILNQKKTIKQDIGKIMLSDDIYYFNNAAGLGLDAFVVKNLNKKLGKLSYILAAFKSVFHFKKSKIKITSKEVNKTVSSLFFGVGICKYSGGGMQFTDNPIPNDGLLDITLVKDISPLALFTNIHRLYNGKLAKHKAVETFKINTISIEILDNNLPFIQADGELIGTGNPKFEIINKAINFIIP